MSETAKEIIFDQVANVVAVTLGPKGRNIGLESSWGPPTISNHGSDIIKDLEVKDTAMNLGVMMAKEVAQKVKEATGDGTTTSIVLLRALVQGGIKNIAAGANPIAIKRGMDLGLTALLKEIDRVSKKITNAEDTENIASVSASGNREIGKVIATAFEKLGASAVISIEEGKGISTHVEIVLGMQLDRGYTSAYFCTNQEKLTAEFTNPYILITDKKITTAQDILPILQHIASSGQSLIIIADDIEGDALSTLVVNKLRGTLKVAAIRAPGFGEQRKVLLEDLAILTGAQVVSEERGLTLKDCEIDILGRADQVTITKDKTTIVGGKGHSVEIQERLKEITAQIQTTKAAYDKQKLEERKAKLQNGVALIQVGAWTESEMKKQKRMYEDSLNATKAALEEGIVPGGGIALLKAAQSLNSLKAGPEELIGVHLLQKACEAPFRQIVENAGHDASTLIEQVLSQELAFGFNTLTSKIENLEKAGVLDPAKVVKSSAAHAVSMAGTLLLSEALIFNAKETA
jgi:chaperonin GroEL